MKVRALLACAVFSAACAHAPARGPRIQRSTGEGWAPITASDPAGTRRRALASALREAVEKAAGVQLTAKTEVDRAMAVEDTITARTRGTLRSYQLLSEIEEGGFHKTRVSALVELGEPEDGAPPLPPAGDPKVSVALTGPNASDAASGVRRSLIARGFTVVDDRADITVRGTVALNPKGLVGPFSSSRARVALEARQVRTGRVLWASGRVASGVGAGPIEAAAKASETAGLLGGEELATQVAARLAE